MTTAAAELAWTSSEPGQRWRASLETSSNQKSVQLIVIELIIPSFSTRSSTAVMDWVNSSAGSVLEK
jgi:hypothetical protein